MPRLKLLAAALLAAVVAGLALGGCSMLTPQTSTDPAVPLVVVCSVLAVAYMSQRVI